MQQTINGQSKTSMQPMTKTFQEFVDDYYGWHIDLCDLTEEDAIELEKLYREEK